MTEAPKGPDDEKRPDRILDHEYDGIREYDNPLPRWWINLFWLTIVYAVLYVANVPVIGVGPGRIARYQDDMARAAALQDSLAAHAPAPAAMDDEALEALARDPAHLRDGAERFATACSPCHRADGGGSIGPNLTDEYWLHGGRPSQMLKLVNEGVPDKGMPTWSQTMKPDEIANVVAYLLTLRGTHPPEPKEPQGEKVETED